MEVHSSTIGRSVAIGACWCKSHLYWRLLWLMVYIGGHTVCVANVRGGFGPPEISQSRSPLGSSPSMAEKIRLRQTRSSRPAPQ
eukprot:4022648-Prymnesium_polylepis.1